MGMMKIDFAGMQVGDSVKLPNLIWGDENRQYHQAACDYMATITEGPCPQFEIRGNDEDKNSRGELLGYTLVRIK
jgi:hypothetical protein